MADFITPETMPGLATDVMPIPDDWAAQVRSRIENRDKISAVVLKDFREKLGDRSLVVQAQ